MKSPKQLGLEKKLLAAVTGRTLTATKVLLGDEEIQHLQDYANTVSIKRLGYNDHGPVHMRKVALNAQVMLDLLHAAGVPLNLEAEGLGSFEDSRIAVLIASFLHDVGMSVGRERHEQASVTIASPIMDRVLAELYPRDAAKRVILRSLATEAIIGHMGTQRIHSLEAGVVLIADGCDMEQGRARIPMMIQTKSRVGDIHKYSSDAIESVDIERGRRSPIRITIRMREVVGFFQVEEVLFPKIDSSPVKPHIELYAGVKGQKLKRYL